MHIPVLLEAAIDWLAIRPDGTYVDCTAGGGGHSEAIAQALGTSGRLICIDRDSEAVARVRKRLRAFNNVSVVHANYAGLAGVLEEAGLPGVDGVLIDAGLSSPQLDTPERGFSFQREGPLDMRMDRTAGITAAELLNTASEEDLARLLRMYGDVRDARKIAKAILARRQQHPYKTTHDLMDTINEVYHFVTGTPEEARTIFQAVRIAVNDEFQSLESGVRAAIDALNPGGRLVCIAFHSGEDRIVKNLMKEAAKQHIELHPDGRVKRRIPPRLRVLTSKPVLPSQRERAENPRAASAKLRAAESLGEAA